VCRSRCRSIRAAIPPSSPRLSATGVSASTDVLHRPPRARPTSPRRHVSSARRHRLGLRFQADLSYPWRGRRFLGSPYPLTRTAPLWSGGCCCVPAKQRMPSGSLSGRCTTLLRQVSSPRFGSGEPPASGSTICAPSWPGIAMTGAVMTGRHCRGCLSAPRGPGPGSEHGPSTRGQGRSSPRRGSAGVGSGALDCQTRLRRPVR